MFRTSSSGKSASRLGLGLVLVFSIAAVRRPLPPPHDLPPPPRRCVIRDSVPVCVEVGLFPLNPRWAEILKDSKGKK